MSLKVLVSKEIRQIKNHTKNNTKLQGLQLFEHSFGKKKKKCLCTITLKSWISEMRFHNLQFAHHLVSMSSNLIFATNNNSNKRKKKLSYARKFIHPKITSSWNQILIPPKPDPTRLKVLSKYSNIKPALPQHRTLAKPQKERPGPIWLNEAKLKTSREHHGGKGLHNASSVEKELKLMNA